MNQPYAAPGADVAVTGNETYQPKFLSLSGRIGRMRYFVYGTGLTFLFYGVLGIAAAIMIPGFASGGEAAAGAGAMILGLVAFVGMIAVMVFAWGFMVRRLNDINASGWLSLLMLLPLVNFVLALILLFKKGSDGGNNYGAAPVDNSGAVKALFAVLLVLLIGYFAVVMPMSFAAYNDYLQQAQSAQFEYPDY
ncbi:hypothetical protein Q670_09905 [Alcanivorax sp. P2S70]|uniref:DUF805 domain-containing protein n=3 Tax=Alcanivoracaceae TaxID=224372 RepID=A0A418Y316_9GAMM|nr:hypothetical protein Q670_09905 [Alcanivorax sp. P2S70]RJG19903.1 DUF805 domain-containing protein [Alcanivorax profundi]